MAKGQYLSRHQQGIVRRFYDHADTRTTQKLQELVSDLYLATDEKVKAELWKSAADMLGKTNVNPARLEKAVAERNLEVLAKLVGEVAASANPTAQRPAPRS